jgi:hypothetical protein
MAQNNDDLPTLVAQTGPLNGQRWVIKDFLLLGRENNCNIVIPSRQVSRMHARVTATNEGILLEDLASKNGTHYNGKPITDPVLLEDGDVIQIALAQQFIFISSDATLPLESVGMIYQDIGGANRRLRLDSRSHRVFVLEREITPPLSAAQFLLLDLLYQRPGQVVPRSQLIQAVWEEVDAVGVSEQALDALIRRLRDRLAAADPTHNYIITVRGHGLRLDNPEIEP